MFFSFCLFCFLDLSASSFFFFICASPSLVFFSHSSLHCFFSVPFTFYSSSPCCCLLLLFVFALQPTLLTLSQQSIIFPRSFHVPVDEWLLSGFNSPVEFPLLFLLFGCRSWSEFQLPSCCGTAKAL